MLWPVTWSSCAPVERVRPYPGGGVLSQAGVRVSQASLFLLSASPHVARMTGLVKCLSLLTKLFGELIIVVSGSRVSQHFSFHLFIMCISCASKSVKEKRVRARPHRQLSFHALCNMCKGIIIINTAPTKPSFPTLDTITGSQTGGQHGCVLLRERRVLQQPCWQQGE